MRASAALFTLLVASLTGFAAGAGDLRGSDALSRRIDAFVAAEMERQHVPGVAIAVIQHGEVLKSQGYGSANLEHRVPVSPATIFESGSLGKQFTAAAVM